MRRHRGAGVALAAAALWLCSCSSANENKRADEQASGRDLLDEPVEADAKDPELARDDGIVIPSAPDGLEHPLDGQASGWDLSEARVFAGEAYVEQGQRLWSGAEDASLRVATQSEPGWLLFWLEVKDDTVLETASSTGEPTDAIVLHLQDPRLAGLLERLPEALVERRGLEAELTVVITPDGRARAADAPEGTVRAAPFAREGSWGAEVAVSLEAWPQLHSLPTTEVAFRVEQLDGDDADRPGPQTRLSMLPDTGPGAARWALARGLGLLPHRPASGAAVLEGAMGYWSREPNGWRFELLEAAPKIWRHAEVEGARQALESSGQLARVCDPATHDAQLLQAMRSRRPGHQAALLLCAPRGECDAQARTELLWVHLKRGDEGGWALERQVDVAGEGLPQCGRQGREGEPVWGGFSMTPLDFLHPNVWAVGWSWEHELPEFAHTRRGVWIFHGGRTPARMAELQSLESRAEAAERTISRGRAHFVAVDKVDGLDLCEIEDIEEQRCEGFARGCQTQRHRRTRLTHVKLWDPKGARLEEMMLSKHRGCPASLRFGQRDGYLLIHTDERIGLIPDDALAEQ